MGQLLDYAANRTAYWPAGTLEGALLAASAAQGQDPDDRLPAIMPYLDTAGFWRQVEANLAAGRHPFLIGLDTIPSELARAHEPAL
ncbi:hypothetical protein Rumeso_04386 [Rubellimicrobium mesophilum DSM 19309]|uniref:Uncharacterized protein n=1 Tax=Rubellimicrobium mesophilum DSM 19309 TaxID=442562 RepID=A0A017HI71_9RHOB|nr:hypothetical protein [Rubellimicrobium mesophilum]EYD74015.1 hypothetical protein Rumeso_04386 [Rubellimicrobium mesophilum DSM 19309]